MVYFVNSCYKSFLPRLTEEQETREGVAHAFQQFISDKMEWRAELDGLTFSALNLEEVGSLEVPFRQDQIISALREMNGDKAPSLDGVMIALWQDCWDAVRKDVMDLFKEFFEKGTFTKSQNATFIVLIPKKGGAEEWSQFRPISLVESLYKLIAKVLANRLKKVVGKVVWKDQNAFVEGRQIIDASLIAKEIVDYWNKKRVKGVVCKLDIGKTYDGINWQFLLKIMHHMGFGVMHYRKSYNEGKNYILEC